MTRKPKGNTHATTFRFETDVLAMLDYLRNAMAERYGTPITRAAWIRQTIRRQYRKSKEGKK